MHQIAFVAVLSVSVPAALSAQTSTTGRTDTSTTTTSTSTSTSTGGSTSTGTSSRWIASGFVGSNFNNNSNELFNNLSTSANTTSSGNSVDFGAQVGYLWHNIAGAEFLAGFTPNFQMQNSSLPGNSATPWVNTYMINAVGAAPLGSDGQFQPFISGGVGAITMRGLTSNSTVSTQTGVSSTASTIGNNLFNPDESRAGGNIGGGVMAYAGNWGVRGDIRYFRALTTNNDVTSTVNSGSSDILPGLNFWRANIGVALRW
jgi:hypothetical protein